MFGLPFHHIGIACADMDAATDYVNRAFAIITDTGIVHDPLQNAYVRLFNQGTPGAIELVSGQVVANLVKRRTTYYHICYTTPDIAKTLQDSKNVGALRVSHPKPAVLFENRLVAFIYTPLGLVEFLEDH